MKIHENPANMTQIAQCNVYRYIEDHYEFLLLKRIDDRKHFWQPITETAAAGENIGAALKRGLLEQAGIEHVKKLSEETYTYEWYTSGERGRDIVFAVEVHSRTAVNIDKHRYLDFAWMRFEDAVESVKWSGVQEALRRLQKRLETEPRTPEIELNTHDAPANTTVNPTETKPGTFVSQVRHSQLPELPEDTAKDFGLL